MELGRYNYIPLTNQEANMTAEKKIMQTPGAKVSYTASSLGEIASLFGEKEAEAIRFQERAKTQREAARWRGESYGYNNAAQILRNTTLTDCNDVRAINAELLEALCAVHDD